MEYEKVREESVCVCVCGLNYAATSPRWVGVTEVPSSGEIQHPEQEDQPHLGLCGDAGQGTAQVHTHTHADTHTNSHTHTHAYMQWFLCVCAEHPNRGGRPTGLFWNVRSRLTG